jgi:predicted PurR-regulated permease PerM
MNQQQEVSRSTHFLMTVASFVIVVAGMKAAASILVPFLVAVVLAVVAGPIVFWLTGKGVGSWLAVLLVVFVLIGVLTLMGISVGSSLNDFLLALPSFQERCREEVSRAVEWLAGRGFEISDQTLLNPFNPGAVMGLVADVLTSVGGLLTNALLIFLTAMFLLLEASSFPAKLVRAFGDRAASLAHFKEFVSKLKRYAAIKTAMSLLTGIAVAIWVWICGIDFPLVWGLLAFLLNYIPNIGSIAAAVPAILLGFIQHGLGAALIVMVGYLVINLTVSNLLEPRFMGKGVGLSTAVVFLSLIVWAWILGPVGMLLSVPLTITLKMALQSSEKTRWIGVLLGPARPEMSSDDQEELKPREAPEEQPQPEAVSD